METHMAEDSKILTSKKFYEILHKNICKIFGENGYQLENDMLKRIQEPITLWGYLT